jgi:predicted ABC-type ATPase
LNCKEFVNADEIARGLSPFNPENVAIKAGRLMLTRIMELIEGEHDFAFETTLATKSYVNFVNKAQDKDFLVTILYFWLESPELALERVKTRVKEGGHSIDEDVIIRRYFAGIRNFFNLYMNKIDNWWLIDNSGLNANIIARGDNNRINVTNRTLWDELKDNYYEE